MSNSRIVTTLFVFLALATPASGSPCAGIPKFDTPLAAEPAIKYHRPAVILRICDRDRALAYVFACADEQTNTIYLTAPEHLRYIGWTEREIACLERHERAHLWHVDGTRWAGDHRATTSRRN
jgi:hypothetical protein